MNSSHQIPDSPSSKKEKAQLWIARVTLGVSASVTIKTLSYIVWEGIKPFLGG
jgi:hypothetical protein